MKYRAGLKRSLTWLTARPIAHRGLHDAAIGIVENTSSAVEAAIANNYAIEIDLQITGDGEAVVFHDYTLDRLTKGHGLLQEKTVAQVRSIRFKSATDRILTLAELLDQVAGRATLVIEIKPNWTRPGPLAARTAKLLKTYDGPCAVMSFDPRSMAAMKEFAPEIVRGIVSERFRNGQGWRRVLNFPNRISLRHMEDKENADPHFLSYNIKDLPSPVSRHFSRAGMPVLSWTVRTPEDVSRSNRYADQMTFEGFRP